MKGRAGQGRADRQTQSAQAVKERGNCRRSSSDSSSNSSHAPLTRCRDEEKMEMDSLTGDAIVVCWHRVRGYGATVWVRASAQWRWTRLSGR